MAQSALQTCEICMCGPGTQFCIDCEQHFCESCKLYHLRARATKIHVFSESSSINTDVISVCKDHNDSFVFICQNCELPVCIHCVAGNHNGHRVMKIEEIVSSLQETIRSTIKMKIDVASKNCLDIETGISKNDLEVNKTIQDIKEDGNKIKAMVDKHVTQLIEYVKEKNKQERAKLLKIQTGIKHQVDKGTELEGKRKELEQTRPNADLVLNLKQLLDDINRIQIEPMPKLPSITFINAVTTEADLAALMGRCNFRETETFNHLEANRTGVFKFQSIFNNSATLFSPSGSGILEILKGTRKKRLGFTPLIRPEFKQQDRETETFNHLEANRTGGFEFQATFNNSATLFSPSSSGIPEMIKRTREKRLGFPSTIRPDLIQQDSVFSVKRQLYTCNQCGHRKEIIGNDNQQLKCTRCSSGKN